MIYFVQRANGDIKIGVTEDFQRRLYGLRSTTREDLVILGVCDGDWSIEEALHVQFKNERREGEWFIPGDALLTYIKANTQAAPEWKTRRQRWAYDLELEYEEEALTLIPRLVVQYGSFKAVAKVAGVCESVIRWWCIRNHHEWYKLFIRNRKELA